jgi:transcriptional regulator with XRE-family HTH domain
MSRYSGLEKIYQFTECKNNNHRPTMSKEPTKDTPFAEQGARLKMVMKDLKLSGTVLAEESGTSSSLISKYIHGDTPMPQRLVIFLYEKYKVRFEFLYLGEGRMILGQSDRQNNIIDLKKLQVMMTQNSIEFKSLKQKYVELHNELHASRMEMQRLKAELGEKSY